MPIKFVDITNQKFNMLLAIKRVKNEKATGAKWQFLCDCGNLKEMMGQPVRLGLVKSCGCATKEYISKSSIKHGEISHHLYSIWKGIMQRCYKKNNKDYLNYGGRGIKVCDDWKISPSKIEKDLGVRPKNNTLERINVNGNYEPSNCKWATLLEQGANKRNNIKFCINGENLHFSEICRRYNIKESTLRNRLNLGMSIEMAISKPVKKRKNDLIR